MDKMNDKKINQKVKKKVYNKMVKGFKYSSKV